MTGHDAKERLPQFSNKRIRIAQIGIEYVDRIPYEIVWTRFGYLRFDSVGRVAPSENGHLFDALLFSEITPVSKGRVAENVIDARARFGYRVAVAKYLWKPTPEILMAISKAVFGGERGS
jgi:hypothetical protein